MFLLSNIADHGTIKIKAGESPSKKGHCDGAVLVSGVDWKHGHARLLLNRVGTPYLLNHIVHNQCGPNMEKITLELIGFDPGGPAAPMLNSIAQILETPERYLAANGISTNAPSEPPDLTPAKAPPAIANPQILLGVDAVYTEQARVARISGSVLVKVIVATDGRVHNPSLAKQLGLGLDENCLRVLPLWRFRPAEQLGRPVAREATVAMSFHLL